MRDAARRLKRRIVGQIPAAPLHLPVGEALLEWRREGTVELDRSGPGPGADDPLRVAVVVPTWREGSGGHATIMNLVRGLDALGHDVAVWLEDHEGVMRNRAHAEVAREFETFFGGSRHPLRVGFDEGWHGADVVLATGWQTVFRVLRLPGARSRAYLVQDHEPEFYATSAEAVWAEQTYRQGLYPISASPWLAGLLEERYGTPGSAFDLGVDHDAYRPIPVPRRDDLVLMYARASTPRRAVPLGFVALAELHRRRPGVEIALFGDGRPLVTPFPHRNLGVMDRAGLAQTYSTATVGMVLSMTNPSLIPTEMLACGLPCVDIASDAMVATFGTGGPVALSEFDPIALADTIERLLDDPALRTDVAREGLELTAGRTWPAAARQVCDGLRAALRQASPGPRPAR